MLRGCLLTLHGGGSLVVVVGWFVVEVAIGLDREMHHEGRGEVVVWESGSVWAVVVVVELGWTARLRAWELR